jgi:hypothetical protein
MPPKFTCDHCGKSIFDDNVTMFYRLKHFHMSCFVHGVEEMKLEEAKQHKAFPTDHLPEGSS